MFGENWRPDQQHIPRYNGPQVAPPRYGPPAEYQRAHLPDNFVPCLPHDGYLDALQYQRREGPWAHCPLSHVTVHAPPVQLQHEYYLPGPQQTALPNCGHQLQQVQQNLGEQPNREVNPGGMRRTV
jgi:hypothetical protein